MLTILKLTAGAALGLAMLNPMNTPKAEDCSCSASADAATKAFVPKAEDCSCKADVD